MKLLSTSLLALFIAFAPLCASIHCAAAVHHRVASSSQEHHHKSKRAETHKTHQVEYGTASWYGAKDQGRTMACGKPFNEHALTAAHRTLPLGTKVKVTDLRNGRSVIVRIRDRGPAIESRLIDLSRAAARRLGFTHNGLAPVKVRVLSVPKRTSKD